MKNAEQQLAATLAENLHASLGGLSEKHTKKLLKKVAKAARLLARKHTRLLAKEQRNAPPAPRPAASAKTAKRRAARPAPVSAAARPARAAQPAATKKAPMAAVR
jgi:hypothetical protein